MDSDEEEFSTTLAYTKSPKAAKRTSFQDELKRAINARVSRQQAIEEPANSDYSDEFESDDSLEEPPDEKKTFQLTAMKTIRNFSILDDDDDLPKKMSFIKSKNDFNKRDGSDKTRDNTKNSRLKSPKEKKKEIKLFDEKESKPIPKPRETMLKSPTSTQDVSVSLSDEKFKPTPQQRHFLKKSSHIQDKDSSQEEDIHTSTKHASFSAPFSLSRLNDKISSSDTLEFAERHSPKGLPLTDSKIKTRSLSDGENNLTVSKEGSPLSKDLKVKEKETFESHGSVLRSPSALDMMLKSINEKTKPQENNNSLEETSDHIIFKSQTLVVGRDGKEENSDLHSLSSRSLPSQRTKNAFKNRTQISAKSRYLGTLTVLDKAMKENSCDVEPADVLRATVYQNWLEKKKVFIHELHKINKIEELKQKEKASKDETVKKEDAAAAFHAWKSEKKKEVKKMLMKQMEDEEKKIKEVQETIRRKEDAQKAFEKWKEYKEDYLKEKVYKEKKTEMEKRRTVQDSAKEKKTSNVSALKTWNEQKEHVLREKKKEKMSEKMKLEEEKAEKEEQEKRAMEIYEEWLEKKEQRERIERKKKKFQFLSDDDPPPPWSPPGKTIPTGK